MIRRLAHAALVLAFAALYVVAVIAVTPPASGTPIKNLACDGTYTGVVVKNVTVKSGDSCVVIDSTILGNVHGKKGAVDIKILDSDIAHNVHVMGAVGSVVIGSKSCRYDPHAGNNVMISKSHNVLICYMSVDNNIRVTGNDGRITVRDSTAGNNIGVDRNLRFVNDGTGDGHRRPGAIRLLRLHADNHVTTKRNDSTRRIIRRDVTQG